MLQLAYDALQSGNPARAEQICRQLLAAQPDNEGGLLLLALGLVALEREAEAMPLFEKLTELNPGSSGHWTNLGSSRRSQGLPEQAEAAYKRAAELDPTDGNALFNLGLLAYERGEFLSSRDFLMRAVEHSIDDAGIRAEAANAQFACGNSAAAERLLEHWQRWSANDPLALAQVGWVYAKLGQAEDAQQALDAAATILPAHPRIQVRRVAFLERANRLDEARTLLSTIDTTAVGREGLNEDLKIVRAQLVGRGDDLALALQLHEEIVEGQAAARRNPELLTAIGRLHDKAGDTRLAMNWFNRAHQLQIEELRERSPKWFGPDADPLEITRHRINAELRRDWLPVEAPDAAASPIFIVGFPRSGTTMLETMLDAHPQLAGMDERTFLQDVVDEIRKAGMNYPEDLGRLDDAMCTRLRGVYWNLVRTRARVDPAKRLVDKNPLNILRLPLITRLFPNAKIILALRHPCDVVLSNFMQTFRTPAYVAITATIESTARGYADTFDFWLDQVGVLEPDVLELRYEDVVDDIDAQSRRIADFLQIPWDARMVDFHVRAKERGYIATPSYHQVVEPINRKGVARWERYRSYLEPAIPHLQPYLDRWDYAVEPATDDSKS